MFMIGKRWQNNLSKRISILKKGIDSFIVNGNEMKENDIVLR